MKTKTTYQKIAGFFRPNYTKRLDARVDDIEQLIRYAQKQLDIYKTNNRDNVKEYSIILECIDDFKRVSHYRKARGLEDKYNNYLLQDTGALPITQEDDLGMYDNLVSSDSKLIRQALDAMNDRLAKDNISITNLVGDARELGKYEKWAQELHYYMINKDTRANLTLNHYRRVKAIVDTITSTSSSEFILNMKKALEKYHMSIFDAIKFKDEQSEDLLKKVERYQSGICRDISKEATKITKPDTPHIADPYGNRTMLEGFAPHNSITAYDNVYGKMYSAIEPLFAEIYSINLVRLESYKFPDPKEVINSAVSVIDTPTSN